MEYICKLDKTLYACISNDIQTDEVIITKRQAAHSDLHSNFYQEYGQYFPMVLHEPDYIFEDSRGEKHSNTGIVTKRIKEADGKVLQIVLRIKTKKIRKAIGIQSYPAGLSEKRDCRHT